LESAASRRPPSFVNACGDDFIYIENLKEEEDEDEACGRKKNLPRLSSVVPQGFQKFQEAA